MLFPWLKPIFFLICTLKLVRMYWLSYDEFLYCLYNIYYIYNYTRRYFCCGTFCKLLCSVSFTNVFLFIIMLVNYIFSLCNRVPPPPYLGKICQLCLPSVHFVIALLYLSVFLFGVWNLIWIWLYQFPSSLSYTDALDLLYFMNI